MQVKMKNKYRFTSGSTALPSGDMERALASFKMETYINQPTRRFMSCFTVIMRIFQDILHFEKALEMNHDLS